MANSNSPHGFAPVMTEQANSYSAQAHMYYIPTSDAANTYSIGDLVASANTADAGPNIWGTFGIPGIAKMTGSPNTTGVGRGVVVSVFRNPFNLDQIYVPQAKAQPYYVLVMDDPNIVMQAQLDGANPYAQAGFVGMNVGFNQVAVNAANVSNSTVYSVPAVTSTLPLKILSVQQQINVSTGLYVPLLVTWNSHELKSVGTTGI